MKARKVRSSFRTFPPMAVLSVGGLWLKLLQTWKTSRKEGVAVKRMKKFLLGLIKTRHGMSFPTESWYMSLSWWFFFSISSSAWTIAGFFEDLNSAETKGKWWLIGAAWGGDDRQAELMKSTGALYLWAVIPLWSIWLSDWYCNTRITLTHSIPSYVSRTARTTYAYKITLQFTTFWFTKY